MWTPRSRTVRSTTPEQAHPDPVLTAAVHAAVRAPSGHNTQPWLFRLGRDSIDLYADRRRALPVVDPDDRALIISCGAALSFLVVALRHAGYAAEVTLLPDPDAPDLLASVGPGHRRTPAERDHQLFAAIAQRHTHRAAFELREVPAEVLSALRGDADRYGATLHVLTAALLKRQIAELVQEGDRAQMADPRFRSELASWMRSSYTRRGDGIPGYALGIPGPASIVGPALMRAVDMGSRQGTKDAALATSAPALLLLSTPGDTTVDWLACGQALGMVLLSATVAGLAASFLNQPVETASLRAILAERVAPGSQPQLLLRLGYPQRPARPTPRRPVAEVLGLPGIPPGLGRPS